MVTVANPVYDVVFKYLMEDMRVARTILSALLQKEVPGLLRLLQKPSGTSHHTCVHTNPGFQKASNVGQQSVPKQGPRTRHTQRHVPT